MQVQNKVSLATPRLPTEVVQQGVVVAKANAGFLMVVALKSERSGDRPRPAVRPRRLRSVLDQIARVPGVGSTQLFGGEYAMHIWLNPDKLHAYGLSASAGAGGGARRRTCSSPPARSAASRRRQTQMFTATVSAEGRFSTPEQFEQILLRTDRRRRRGAPEGRRARRAFRRRARLRPEVERQAGRRGFAVQLAPGANALAVAAAVQGSAWPSCSRASRKGVQLVLAVRQLRLRAHLGRRGGQDAGRGDGAGVPGDAAVPAEPARHARSRRWSSRSRCSARSWA